MIRKLPIAAAALVPILAHGSFGGGACRDFGCYFTTWGLLIGVVGVPVAAVILGVLHAWLCHPGRSKINQFFLGGALGAVAYEIATACAAAVATSSSDARDYFMTSFVASFVILAIVSVLYARQAPR